MTPLARGMLTFAGLAWVVPPRLGLAEDDIEAPVWKEGLEVPICRFLLKVVTLLVWSFCAL